jgi:hypothetical protein
MSSTEMTTHPTTIMILPANTEHTILDVNVANDHINQYDDEEDTRYDKPVSGLTPVAKCCLKRQCFNKFAPQVQEDCFNRSLILIFCLYSVFNKLYVIRDELRLRLILIFFFFYYYFL